MGEPIEQRGRELFVAGEHGDPFGKREIRGDNRGAAFISVRDQIEEQLAAGAIKGDEAELVDLCGAPHKSINATPAVMWSRYEPDPASRGRCDS
jgi:hypothetical protein